MKVEVIEGREINALAHLNGKIYITRGLVRKLTVAQTEGVIAHETAHHNHKHLYPKVYLFILGAISPYFVKGLKNKWKRSILMLLVRNAYSLLIELDADLTAKRKGHGEDLAQALEVMHKLNTKLEAKHYISCLMNGNAHPPTKLRTWYLRK